MGKDTRAFKLVYPQAGGEHNVNIQSRAQGVVSKS